MSVSKQLFLVWALVLASISSSISFAETPAMTNALDLESSTSSAPQKTLYNLDVDTQTIQNTWLWRVNRERSIRWLSELVLDETLNTTAIERAEHLANTREFNLVHRRPGQTCANYRCYNPWDWFAQRWVSRSAQETVLFWWYFGKDSTENLIETLRGRIGGPSGFLGLIIGEMSYNGVHYRMMLNPHITKLWVGVASAHHPWFGSAYMAVIHFE